MLKLIKSKAFKVAGLVIAMAMMLTATASAATTTVSASAFNYSGKMTQGMSGPGISTLQAALNSVNATQIIVDGDFGPATCKAVKEFQTAHMLTADCIVGPMTGAALAAATVAVITVPTTESLCPNGMTLASNCTTAPSTTPAQALCPNGMTLASNCTTAPTTGGVVTGGAGDATITGLSTPSSSTKVGEGDNNKQVFGVEIEADNNSDLSITSMKLSFVNGGSGSKRFNRYADSVSIWYNGVKVGSANVEDFSENSDTYSKSINITGAIVKADTIGKFYVAVDAIDDIDSGNTGSSNNTWTVTLDSTRYQDGMGAILTDSTASLTNTFIFDTLASTNDVELKVNLSSSTPASNTVKVSTTSDTNQVELMKFTMKAQGSAMHIDEIPVSFTTSGTLFEVTNNVTLVIDGKTFNESIATGTSTDGSSTIGNASTAVRIFDDLDLDLDSGETITGTVYADINDIDTNFAEGHTLLASITSAIVTATSGNNIDVEDSNGDQLVTGDRTGSAVGNTMTFRSTGVNVDMGTVTYDRTTDTNGLVTSVKYTIPVAVTSFGNTLYIGQSAQLATAASVSNAFALVVETAAAPNSESVSATTSITLSTSDAQVESNGYRLDDGQTKHFTIIVNMLAGTDNTSHRFRLDTIRTFTGAGLDGATATNSDLLPVTDYRTDFQFLNS